MSAPVVAPRSGRSAREGRPRHYLMCPPTFFEVSYRINPWMEPAVPVDHDRAVRQWTALRDTYERLGHHVSLIEPAPGLPDMVFAANAGLVVDGRVLSAHFLHSERRGEEGPYRRWFANHGFREVRASAAVNEGEGDFAVVGRLILAGTGFRTEMGAHAEVGALFGRPVVTLQLVDPRFYHLDTALAVLDDERVAYFPGAFSADSAQVLARLFPDAIIVSEADACVLGVNAASDGYHVVLSDRAEQFAEQLSSEGFEPVPIDLSELTKAGGSVKCCTLELRP